MQYILVRSKYRRRSVAMQLSRSGEVIVRAPMRMPKFFIDRFVAGHADWIAKQQVERAKPQPLQKRYFPTNPELEKFIKEKVGEYSAVMSLHPLRLRFRHVRSYWGSCSPSGVISFNHHLSFAPPEAVEYVIVHELCHLKYRCHGVRFWDLVNKYYPNSAKMRKVLRSIAR